MQEKLEQVLAKLKETNDKLSKKQKMLIIAGVAAIIIIALAGALLLNKGSSEPLFVNLTQQEATEIVGKLQDMGVNPSYQNGTITVPASQTDKLRAQLVMQGYPHNGLSYEVFKDNASMMGTDLERETYKLYDLQNRIAATIRYFDGVQDAVVTISTGSDNKYVLQKDKQPPSASVAIFMRNGGAPGPGQVQGIQRLVASAVPGMDSEDVVVLDGAGNYVSETEASAASATSVTSATARLKRELEKDIERSCQAKLMGIFTQMYGEGHVSVSVSCNVDVKKKLQEIVNYTPSQDNRGVIQREVTGIEAVGPGTVTGGGTPGTDTNAVIPIYPNITSDGTDIYYTDEREFDYLVSYMKEQIQDDGGDIVDLTVGVAVDLENLSRTQKEDLRQLAAATVGISLDQADQKVALMNAPFYGETRSAMFPFLEKLAKDPYLKWILLAALGLLLFIIVVVVLLIKNMRKKKEIEEIEEEIIEIVEGEEQEIEKEEALSGVDPLLPLDQMKKTREMELKEQIGEFADLNPEIAAQLIKTWLRGESENE